MKEGLGHGGAARRTILNNRGTGSTRTDEITWHPSFAISSLARNVSAAQ